MGVGQDGRLWAVVHGDCRPVMADMPAGSVDMVFADPPYKLSSGGITCRSGKIASVDKADWDRPLGFDEDHAFHMEWLTAVRRVLKPNGTLWVSGTYHAIYSVAFAMQSLGYHIINDICWFKPNAPPNMARRCFTASHETLIWAKLSKKARHTFNYERMREANASKQMRTVWTITAPSRREKVYGRHPTQKPLALLTRCIEAASQPGDLILDPFCGSGTTGVAAVQLGRRFVGIELEPEYCKLSVARINAETPN